MDSRGNQVLLGLGLGALLFLVYLVVGFFWAVACTDGSFTQTRSALCEIERSGVSTALLFTPPLSVVVLAIASVRRPVLLRVFSAWVVLAVVAGIIVVQIASYGRL